MSILLTDEEMNKVYPFHAAPLNDDLRELLNKVAKAHLKKIVKELSNNGWVLARKKASDGAWILDLVGWETLDWQALLKEVEE